jgi:hypothetical protein
MCVGVCAQAGAQAYPRARAGACVYVCTGARVCAYVCARVHGLILPTLLYINPLTERVPVYV